MDTSKIFSLFEDSPQPTPVVSKRKKQAVITIPPEILKIKGFKKILQNYNSIYQTVITAFLNADPNLSPTDMKKAGDWFIYTKAHQYIANLDGTNPLIYNLICNDEELADMVEKMMLYFAEMNEFEVSSYLQYLLVLIKPFSLLNLESYRISCSF